VSRVARVALLGLAAIALGILGDEGLRWGQVGVAVFTAPTPWILLAFAAGRQVSRWWLSAVLGGAALAGSLAVYYAWMTVVHDVDRTTVWSGGYDARLYLSAGLVVGLVTGLLGGVSRGTATPRSELGPGHMTGPAADVAWCGLVAVPVVDGVLQYRYAGWDEPWVSLAVFGAVAVVACGWALASGARRLTLAWGVPAVSAILYVVELVVLREVFGLLTWV
jgi:hypothetical protein